MAQKPEKLPSKLQDSMQVIEISQFGAPDVLKLAQRPLPQPKSHEILIKTAAAGVNRPDLLQRMGNYPVPANASDLPGLEISGQIVGFGDGIANNANNANNTNNTAPNPRNLQMGDKVVALCNGGGYAEYCAVPIGQVLPCPQSLTLTEAAAICETIFTVWYNVFMRAGLTSGEILLVHGAASGIGTTAIQLGKAMGARVFATARAGRKLDLCRQLGADVVIDRDAEDFVAICRQHSDQKGVNLVLDMVGGDYTPRNIDVLAMDGRLAQIAFLRGNKTELDLNLLMRKRLTLTGSTLRPQSDESKAKIASEIWHNVWPFIAMGKFKPVIDQVFPMTNAAAAHHALETTDIAGKIVLEIDQTLINSHKP